MGIPASQHPQQDDALTFLLARHLGFSGSLPTFCITLLLQPSPTQMTRERSLKYSGSESVQYKVPKIHNVRVPNLWAQQPGPWSWSGFEQFCCARSRPLVDLDVVLMFLMLKMAKIHGIYQTDLIKCVCMHLSVSVHTCVRMLVCAYRGHTWKLEVRKSC